MAGSLVLASQSPRRKELLAQAGFVFTVHAADLDESRHAGEAPEAYVQRLALEKAQAVLALYPEATVLGADTTVVLDGETLGKPQDAEEARAMLRSLAGRAHEVHTGLAVVRRTAVQPERVHLETTRVIFDAITPEDLEAYVASGDPLDKAGAYGIQGFAARWIPRIEGDYFNVVGLPLAATVRMLRD
ncbi:MAG: Maf family protein [Acidobacteriaceae bacterium]|nr:Maf family protein [Acidobacteriaceae bacterium]